MREISFRSICLRIDQTYEDIIPEKNTFGLRVPATAECAFFAVKASKTE